MALSDYAKRCYNDNMDAIEQLTKWFKDGKWTFDICIKCKKECIVKQISETEETLRYCSHCNYLVVIKDNKYQYLDFDVTKNRRNTD